MNEPNPSTNTAGSQWRRWDPHIHSPGTMLNDQFGGDWETFLQKLESATPAIHALGITDYCSIQGYRTVRAHQRDGGLQNIGLIFPNVEFRLDVKTEKAKGINLHLLFSPHDSDHEGHIERLLGSLRFEYKETQYACTPTALAQLGRAFHDKPLDEAAAIRAGTNQFKASLIELKALFKDPWMQRNALVAVSGSGVDGTAGLQGDDSFAATRQSIERFAHVIFSGNPKQRQFWLGKTTSANAAQIEKTYGFLKPCLIGCDAHDNDKVAEPDLQRFCWIKGDLSFETLRQSVIEPEERTWIGPEAPMTGMASFVINAVTPSGMDWFRHPRLKLNPGLVTVIGARGSGKTALVDIIAAGTHAIQGDLAESSFLRRASSPINFLEGASVQLTWGDDTESGGRLDHPAQEFEESSPDAQARYLSQQFVDRLCSSSGLAVELRREIERVVFEAIDPTDRMETDSFEELAEQMLNPIRSMQQQFREHIGSLSDQISTEDINQRALPGLQQKHKASTEQIEKLKKELAALLPKDKEVHTKLLASIETAYRAVEQRLEALNLKQKKIADLKQQVTTLREYSEPARWEKLRQTFEGIGLSDPQWQAFQLVFAGDVDSILAGSETVIAREIAAEKSGNSAKPVDLTKAPASDWPLDELAKRLEEARKAVGIDAESQKKYDNLLRRIRMEETLCARLSAQIAADEGADTRRQDLIAKRRNVYLDVFRSFLDEDAELQKLYKPLAKELEGAQGALAKLQVVVYRKVNLADWATRGEDFVDLRTAEKLKGRGTLKKEAERLLLPAWMRGTPEDVANAMEAFRTEFHTDLLTAIPKSLSADERSVCIQQMAAWLYDTSHIRVEYGIQFDGVAIEQLSPGTRGIVLLLLYLAIDKRDQRPLIVDQPEENLDPQSVYEELVPHFRDARKRRQVILVTHNANLVVNTDADQVIIASAHRSNDDGLPEISYQAGSLEDPEIRQEVCNILEGGNRAFLERERRYRFRWEETIAS